MVDVPCFIGIDVANQVRYCRAPLGERWAVPNDASGVTTLVDRLQALQPTLIVLEAAGGLERAVTSALATAGLPVVVVNPRQVAAFCPGHGPARQNGRVGCPRPGPLCRRHPSDAPAAADAETPGLRALLGRRQQLVGMRTAEQNRLAGRPRASQRTLRPL